MDLLLDEDIFTNDINYFFSLHGPRFEYMNNSMAASLTKRFGKKFRPIRILSAWPGKHYGKENYIVLNEKGYEYSEELGKPAVYLIDYEDVNVEFARNKTIQGIAEKLLAKQDTVFVYPFTTSFLDLPADVFTVLGPDSTLAKKYDSKISQVRLFEQLNLPRNNVKIIEDEATLLEQQAEILPCYLSAAYTSGGSESGLIYDTKMLHDFLAQLRPVNKQDRFLAADIFEDLVLAPNVSALITARGETYVLVIADQILQDNRYLGNLYPSLATKKQLELIHDITTTLGNHLAAEGYRGLFGCDFLINQRGDLVVVDLNPRHQGGYVCNGLALKQKGIRLTDIELATLQGEEVALSQNELDNELGFAWSHSKLIPDTAGWTICDEYLLNDIEKPFEVIGESFVAEFYKKGSIVIDGYIGYQVQTAHSRDQLEAKMQHAKKQYEFHVLKSH